MKIVNRKKVEDCFDGSSVFTYWFDNKWHKEAIEKLNSLGELQYFPEFPRPFFRLIGKKGFQVKGVEGENNCRVILPGAGKEEIKLEFESLFKI